jgi:hypothetical protein
MVQTPVSNQDAFHASLDLAHGEIGAVKGRPHPLQSISTARLGRTLSIYEAAAGYDLEEELNFLSNRAMEPNVFFNSRFLAPAMPRLEDRVIRLAIMRDETNDHSRLRLLMPFSIEKPGFAIGTPIIRAWSNPFGPLGTPLVDAENAGETIDQFFTALGEPDNRLPGVLVLPDIRISGPFAQMARAIAISRNLPVSVANAQSRPMLESLLDGETYLAKSVSKEHLRDMRRQWGRLEKTGKIEYSVARQPRDIRNRMEEFLRSEERRVGKECRRLCRSRWSPYH